jgi:acetamidase/formamidase
VAVHELPLERRTLHGHFSRELDPVLTVDPGDSLRFSSPDASWGIKAGEHGGRDRVKFTPRDPILDAGHALVGPIAVKGALPGAMLSIRIDELVVGTYGFTDAGGWESWLNSRLGIDDGEDTILWWDLDAEGGIGTDQHGRRVRLQPFPGVVGMPPPLPLTHETRPPRRWGGNIDCKELVVGSTLFLPIPVEGGLLSLGDPHAAQGDGEVSGLAIECGFASAQVTIDLRDDLVAETPLIRTVDSWISLGLDEDLDDALLIALEAMLELIGREHGVERRQALALASVAVDLRVTQVVNEVKGVHAVLRDDAIEFGENRG